MGRTTVLGVMAQVIAASVLLMSPNYWAEILGTVKGYLIPEILLGVIFTMIGVLLSATGTGEALIAARIATFMVKMKKLMATLGKAGKVILRFLEWVKEIMTKIAKFGGDLLKDIKLKRKMQNQSGTRTVEYDGVNRSKKQTGAGSQIASADAAYDTIRTSTTDVNTIAKNTGLKPENIKKVKNHLFYDEHLLDRYENYGVPAEIGRFDSDVGIANAWKRLETGNYTPDDISLLKHETAEAWYMKKNGSGYTKAHDVAQKRFPAPQMEGK